MYCVITPLIVRYPVPNYRSMYRCCISSTW